MSPSKDFEKRPLPKGTGLFVEWRSIHAPRFGCGLWLAFLAESINGPARHYLGHLFGGLSAGEAQGDGGAALGDKDLATEAGMPVDC
ncbi:hypothetical protein OKA05_01550 [Luteolibacter arcticus]|uniref:Uncharacterized protein n=1 Tax=Luteolibacter arcticus TaxID=1581411 RepID=A0ABT3GCP5_9BACT|nr:hypothetical protein [Luteolibacter arcticus]MCW1921216.1 hypothetical protein [Luteolibacter arcticus]